MSRSHNRESKRSKRQGDEIELRSMALNKQDLLAELKKAMFTVNSTVNLQQGTTLALYNHDRALIGKPHIGIWKATLNIITQLGGGGILPNRSFPVGQFVLEQVRTTCFLMSFIEEQEKRELFAFNRSQQLIERLKIIIKGINNPFLNASSISDTFYQQLMQTIHMSTLLSYNPEGSKKYTHDTLIFGAYINKVAPAVLAGMIKWNTSVAEDAFQAVGMKNEWQTASREFKAFFTNLVTEYIGTTQLKKEQALKAFIIFPILFSILTTGIGYLFKITGWWLTMPAVFGVFAGIVAGFWYKKNRVGHILTPSKITSFARNAEIYFDRLSSKEKPAQLKNTTSRELKRLPKNEKAYLSLWTQYKRHLSMDWSAYEAATEVKNNRENEPAYCLNYTSSNLEGDSTMSYSSQYTYDSAYGAFEKAKRMGRVPKGRGMPETFTTLATQMPTMGSTNKLNIGFSSIIGCSMSYNENDLENSTMFPFRSGKKERQFVWIDPKLKSQIDLEDCQRRLQNLTPSDIEQMHGDIRDPGTQNRVECWEFRLAGGVRILGSPIQVSHEGATYTIYAFNTQAPRKAGSSDRTPLPTALAAPLPATNAGASSSASENPKKLSAIHAVTADSTTAKIGLR